MLRHLPRTAITTIAHQDLIVGAYSMQIRRIIRYVPGAGLPMNVITAVKPIYQELTDKSLLYRNVLMDKPKTATNHLMG